MARGSIWNELLRLGKQLAQQYMRPQAQLRPTSSSSQPTSDSAAAGAEYPGDFTGTPHITYGPIPDSHADPGEIVWTWVPFEEDHSQGKDRPVLVIGRDGGWLLALQVSTKDSAAKHEHEEAIGRHWVDIGSGDWDQRHRPSEVRTNRILRIDPQRVRRIGATLDQSIFDAVAREVRRYYR